MSSWRSVVVTAFLWIWGATVFLAFAQIYFMARIQWTVPAGILGAIAIGWLGWVWGRRIAAGGWLSCRLAQAIGAIHIVPLVLQVVGLASPRTDNLLLALIGWALVEAGGVPGSISREAQSPPGSSA